MNVILLMLTRSLREPGGPCTKSMDVSESRMERVNVSVLKGYTLAVQGILT